MMSVSIHNTATWKTWPSARGRLYEVNERAIAIDTRRTRFVRLTLGPPEQMEVRDRGRQIQTIWTAAHA